MSRILWLELFVATVLFAQQAGSISGQVVANRDSLAGGLTVEVYDPMQGEVLGRAAVRLDGSFECPGLPPGQYLVRLSDLAGVPLQQTLVSVRPEPSMVQIILPVRQRRRPVAGMVSARYLSHKVPSKALREFRREEKALREGDLPGSIAHLKCALELDPDFMEAHNNLGVRFMATHEYAHAAAEFQRAVELDPAATLPRLNWAGALYNTGRYGEAETEARQALAREPDCPFGQLVLGLTLLAEHKSPRECLRNLESAAPKYPKASVFAAELRRELAALSSNAGQPADGDRRQQ